MGDREPMPREKDRDPNSAPYAGRWVARVHGQIVGHGGTPTQARLAAGLNRHKERPEISFMFPASPLRFPALLERVLPHLSGAEVYLTGGAVRDALLGRESHDFDFAVRKHAIALARRVARAIDADFYVLDKDFDAARVIVRPTSGPRDILDFAAFRGEDVDADLAGRDFTINAIAFDPADGTLLDPVGGATDLRAKLIRVCSDGAIRDDPIRILRAVRLAASLGFKIEAGTREKLKRAASLLPNASAERQRDELFKILEGPAPDSALKALDMLGTMPFFLPEIASMKGVVQSPPHVYDVWAHTLAVMRHLGVILETLGPDSESIRNRDLFSGLLAVSLGRYRQRVQDHFAEALTPDRSLRSLLFFAALYHDVAKPATRTVDETGQIRFIGHETEGAKAAAERAGTYNLSNDETSRIAGIVGNHMRFNDFVAGLQRDHEPPTRRAIYRYFRAAGDTGLDLVLLGLADQWGMREHTLDEASWGAALEVARLLLENFLERPEESVEPPRLLDGNDIMRHYGIQAGPAVGELLEAIREAQATGQVTDRETALQFGRDWLEGRAP